jgi:hypothetical protein
MLKIQGHEKSKAVAERFGKSASKMETMTSVR